MATRRTRTGQVEGGNPSLVGHSTSVRRNFDPGNERDLDHECWCPRRWTVLQLIFTARFCAMLWSNISDCDETFNYWEPTHYLIYGSGFQTWEYSPKFAIRSYGYLLLHTIPGHILNYFSQAGKPVIFYFLRLVLATVCAACETYFYSGVVKQFGNHVGRLVFLFLVFSSGMFISSSAYLPSSFAMYMFMLAYGGWYSGNYSVAVLGTAAGALVGWPFSVALGIPIAWDLLARQWKLMYFLQWSVISLISILGPLVYVDTYYYGKTVVAPLNIVLYNVFGQGGPDLYGVEPWTFYFVNCFLNFNVVFIMALAAVPASGFVKFATRKRQGKKFPSSVLPVWLSLSGMYIWILIFFTRPHKEERFLFPIYPLFSLCGAVTLAETQKLYHFLFSNNTKRHYSSAAVWLVGAVGVLYTALSLSRSMALTYGYHAPLELYIDMNHIALDPAQHTLPPDKDVNVCVGKEWYRFPSSFFLPSERWHLKFIKSEFKGQLPNQYSNSDNATKIIPTDMNDMNREEPTRYVPITKCHYLVDLDTDRETPNEPSYSRQTDSWSVVASRPFLDQHRSHRFFRAFYVPLLSSRYTTYINYNLLKTTRRVKKKIK